MRISPGPGSPTWTGSIVRTSGPPACEMRTALSLIGVLLMGGCRSRVARRVDCGYRASLPTDAHRRDELDPTPGPDADPAPAAVGRQRRGRALGRPAGAAAAAQRDALDAGLRAAAADRPPGARAAARPGPAAGPLGLLRADRAAGHGLLQRAAVPGAAQLHRPQRDADRRQPAGVDAGGGRAALSRLADAPPARRGAAVARRRRAGDLARTPGTPGTGAVRAGRPADAAGRADLGLLQLAAGAAARPHAGRAPARLGLVRAADGADAVRAGLQLGLGRRGAGHRRAPGALGLADGGGTGLRGGRAVADRLPLLGAGRRASGADAGRLLRQPDAGVRGADVGGAAGRMAGLVPRRGLRADRGGDRGVLGPALKSEAARGVTAPAAPTRR